MSGDGFPYPVKLPGNFSRPAAAPIVNWSAWSETDADSHPSDPGVSYCTEWFIGRWPIGAEEPECRVLIGSGRSAEVIARRVAEKLSSILNTDRLRAIHPQAEAAPAGEAAKPAGPKGLTSGEHAVTAEPAGAFSQSISGDAQTLPYKQGEKG